MAAVQNDIEPKHLAEATSLLVWAQYVGPTIFIVLYNTVFTTSLRKEIPRLAPNADADAIISAGATRFRNFVSQEDLRAVLVAYSNAIDYTFYLVAGVGALAFLAAFGMGWRDIRKPKPGAEAPDAAGGDSSDAAKEAGPAAAA